MLLDLFRLRKERALVLLASLALVGLWLGLNYARLSADPDGRIRFLVGLVFALLLLFRRKPFVPPKAAPALRSVLLGVGGAVLCLAGLIFRVHQFEWLGLVLVVCAGLLWALPLSWSLDVIFAMVMLYWVHPMPGQVLGPLQLLMQRLSVGGAEWALHCMNVRAWAEHLVIHTGFRTFEVPRACSGMRTSVTVLLCCLGSGFLFRFRPRQIGVLMGVGLCQVLALNIARITMMVSGAGGKSPRFSADFLHDTTGAFLLGAIVLIQAEAAVFDWWRRRRNVASDEQARSASAANWMQMTSGFRVFVVTWRALAVLLAVVLLLGLGFAGYKRRPSHRATMIHEVGEALIETNLEAAEAATARAVALQPDKTGYQVTHARVLLLREKYARALEVLAAVPAGRRDEQHIVLRCWGLIGDGRPGEAKAILDGLPESRKEHPGIAIATAEFAAGQDDVDTVARYAVHAARWTALTMRVRRLFPYLAAHERWQAIADADTDRPYVDADQLLIAATAHMLHGNMERADRLMRRNEALWMGDKRFTRHILILAMREETPAWRAVYADTFVQSLGALSADEICGRFEPCFLLQRPDLAWQAHVRLATLDPSHPALLMMPARYLDRWTTWQPGDLGVELPDPGAALVLRSGLAHLAGVPFVGAALARAPLREALDRGDQEALRKGLLERALAEFERRAEAGRLSHRLALLHADALEMADRPDAAHRALDALEPGDAEARGEVLLRRARLYSRQELWQRAYEALRELDALNELRMPVLYANMVHVLMRLDQGFYAMEVVRAGLETFPNSEELGTLEAAIWEAFGYEEQALALLRRMGIEEPTPGLVHLLERTGRFNEAARMRRVMRLPQVELESARRWVLPMAERCVTWPATPAPDEGGTGMTSVQLRPAADASPFLHALHGATREWATGKALAGTNGVARWTAVGRDRREQVAALHKLALLAARGNDAAQAIAAAERAIEFSPRSCILWRFLLAVSNGDPQYVEQARRLCPGDPEIWLADLVTRVRGGLEGADARALVTAAGDEQAFPAAVFVRAADFLLRARRPDAAETAVQKALQREADYYPAYVVGLKTALTRDDEAQALRHALRAADLSPDPWPFRKMIVQLKMAGDHDDDPDLVHRLEALRKEFGQDVQWSLQLGTVHFRRGAPAAAWSVFAPLFPAHEDAIPPGVLILAAEAARQTGHTRESVVLLRRGHARYPDDVHLLNNLVFTLARTRDGVAEAERLLPRLLEMGQFAAIHDTAGVVLHRAGKLKDAEGHLREAMALANQANRMEWQEIHINAAEVQFELGRYDEAQAILDDLRKSARHAVLADKRALNLMRRLDEQRREARRAAGGR